MIFFLKFPQLIRISWCDISFEACRTNLIYDLIDSSFLRYTYLLWLATARSGRLLRAFISSPKYEKIPKRPKKSSNTMSERELTINSHVVFSYVQVCNRHIKSAGHSQLTWIQVFWWSNLCFSLKTYKLLSVLKILAKSWISWNSKLLVC